MSWLQWLMLLDIDTVENVEIELILFLSQYLSIKSLDDNKKNLIKLRLFLFQKVSIFQEVTQCF